MKRRLLETLIIRIVAIKTEEVKLNSRPKMLIMSSDCWPVFTIEDKRRLGKNRRNVDIKPETPVNRNRRDMAY